jgi:hypothetical protein
MAADYQQYDYIEKRLRYFDGQFLKDQDFIDEQKYHIDRQRRPLRQLHVSGIVEGLTVMQGSLENPDELGRATVMPGTAIDRQGRQIVLGSPRNIPLEKFVKTSSNLLLGVYISYQEIPSDLAAQDNESHRRWHEQSLITVIEVDESGEGIPENGIWLGGVTLGDLGQVTVLDTVRRYAGIHLPSPSDNPSEQGLTLRSTGFNGFHEATLTGKLTVTGGLDISGTVFVTEGLNVSGNLSVNQNLNVAGALSVTEISNESGDLSITDNLNVSGSLNVSGILSAFRMGVGTPTPSAALTVQTPGHDFGNVIRFEGKGEPSRYYLNLTTQVTDSVVRWVFDQQNFSTNYPNVLAIDRGNIGIGTSDPTARLDIPGTEEVTLLSVGASLGSKSNINLCGHVQLREYSDQGIAYLQARDDNSNRDIGLRFRTQLKGDREKTLVEALTIEPNGKITSPMWRVSDILADAVFNGKVSAKFNSGGGTLIVMASGSGRTASVGFLGMTISVNKQFAGSATVWTNEINSHKAFVTNFCVVKNVKAGTHVLELIPYEATTSDANDRCSVTILEVPF